MRFVLTVSLDIMNQTTQRKNDMTELEIQTLLIQALKDAGGYGWKTDHKHMGGLPDLTVGHMSTGVVYIETKLLVGENNIVLVSPIQTATMQRMQKAGFNVGVAAIKRFSPGDYEIYVTSNVSKVRLDVTFTALKKVKGDTWPILKIMKILTTMPWGHGDGRHAVSDMPPAASEAYNTLTAKKDPNAGFGH